MATNNIRTITDDTNDRNDKFRSDNFEKAVKSQSDKTFQVQNYRDYNVFSDVENVLNLNQVTYIDYVKALQIDENKRCSDIKDDRESLTKSLTNNIDDGRILTNVEVDKPSSFSSFIKTASHIIAPVTTSKKSLPVRRIPRRDNSEQNYYDDLALNHHTISLFGVHKTGKSPSVTQYLSI